MKCLLVLANKWKTTHFEKRGSFMLFSAEKARGWECTCWRYTMSTWRPAYVLILLMRGKVRGKGGAFTRSQSTVSYSGPSIIVITIPIYQKSTICKWGVWVEPVGGLINQGIPAKPCSPECCMISVMGLNIIHPLTIQTATWQLSQYNRHRLFLQLNCGHVLYHVRLQMRTRGFFLFS